MRLFILILLPVCIAVQGCNRETATTKEAEFKGTPSALVGTWRSKHSTFTVYADGRFEFTPLVEGDKSRGNGVWERSKDGGYYIRCRAESADEYRYSQAEYFRLVDGAPTFFHIDSEEKFNRVAEKSGSEGEAG